MPVADLLSQMGQAVKRVKPDDFLQRERKLIYLKFQKSRFIPVIFVIHTGLLLNRFDVIIEKISLYPWFRAS
jgi:hypothetical protein